MAQSTHRGSENRLAPGIDRVKPRLGHLDEMPTVDEQNGRLR